MYKIRLVYKAFLTNLIIMIDLYDFSGWLYNYAEQGHTILNKGRFAPKKILSSVLKFPKSCDIIELIMLLTLD